MNKDTNTLTIEILVDYLLKKDNLLDLLLQDKTTGRKLFFSG